MTFSKCKSGHITNSITPSSPMALRIKTKILKVTLQLISPPFPISVSVLQLHLALLQCLDSSCFLLPHAGCHLPPLPVNSYLSFILQLPHRFLRKTLQGLPKLEVPHYALIWNYVPLLCNACQTVAIQNRKSHKSVFDPLVYTEPSTVSGI